MKNLSLIVAVADNGVIGISKHDNFDMPWRCKRDLEHFKSITYGHTVIMGRKTFESMGCKPLVGRKNIVITTNPDKYINYDIVTAGSLLDAYNKLSGEKAFIIGGASVYKYAIEDCEEMYITHMHKSFDGDTKFPLDCINDEWKCVDETACGFDDTCGFSYTFKHYLRTNYI